MSYNDPHRAYSASPAPAGGTQWSRSPSAVPGQVGLPQPEAPGNRLPAPRVAPTLPPGVQPMDVETPQQTAVDCGSDDDSVTCEFECCAEESTKKKIKRVLAMLLIAGIWVAFMFMHIAIFTGIGKTSNWLTCLAYVFLGLPAAVIVFMILTNFIEDVADIEMPSSKCLAAPMIGIMAMISWFAIGIPLTMLTAQEHALVRYLDPQFQQDRVCYREVQPNYKHGSVHFIFLRDREWEVDEKSFQAAKMPYATEGHYFYGVTLRYRGKAAFNCPRAILLTCYHESSSQMSFSWVKRKCWNEPPTGVSIRVLNQNEQFYRNWLDENDSKSEKFMRSTLVPKFASADRGAPLVTYNGDHPLDFIDKLDEIRKLRRALLIFTWVWWSVMIFIYVFVRLCIVS